MVDVVKTPAVTSAPRTSARRVGAGSRWSLRALAVAYVGILVLVPVGLIVYRTFEPGLSPLFDALSSADTVHAFKVTAVVAGIAVAINAVFGLGVAFLLARYRFPGRGLLSGFIDLPIAISPIVVGLALILVYGGHGWFGSALSEIGLQVIGSKPGMVLATVFVSLPLVVRAIVPVLEHEGTDQEQAAQSLGANAIQRFLRITWPTIRTAAAYGIVLSIARCLGEYGAVLVVSGNFQGQTETATLRISNLYELDLDTNSAYALTFVLVTIAVVAIVLGALIRRRQERIN